MDLVNWNLHPVYIVLFYVISIRCFTQNLGPSNQSEAYFNGSSYLRLQTTISLKKQTGLSFRTCSGGNLFSQQQNDDLLELSISNDGLIFLAKTAGKQFEEVIDGHFINNKWHTVQLQYKLGNLTMEIDNDLKLIANSTYNHELLTSPGLYNEGAAVLLVGKHFSGCLLEGPSLIFDNTIITSSHNVQFQECPISEDNCAPKETAKGFDFCMNEPCMRHGTCINGQSGYTCNCLPRYTGKNCEIDIGNLCEKIPLLCKNGATCISDNTGEYMCNCLAGFTGKHCQNEIRSQKFCKNNPCLNGATCIDQNNSNNNNNHGNIECLCLQGFSGSLCEFNIDECNSNPCKHNGDCIDGVNNFTCDCTHTGYTGRLCDMNINECLSNPCLNRGICFDNYGSYLCQCLPGFAGVNCEHKIRECMSHPCLNNGDCIDHSGTYECHCLTGFSGKNCEIEEHQRLCDSTTCPYFADCINNGNGISCKCKNDYPGIYPNCSGTNDICQKNPCKNGGVCTPWKGSFNCTCLPGYTGFACETFKYFHIGGVCYKDTIDLIYSCICYDGWMGPNCDVKINCSHNPCQQSLHCQDYLGGYYCTCKSGWSGLNCNMKLGHCSSQPCLNNGICIDYIDFYYCQCTSKFTGKMCQINVDGCASSPCVNGGVCIDQPNGYLCNCTDQWMGILCEKPYDACDFKPCHNNGTCISSLSSSSQSLSNRHDFTCNCLSGFEGDHCEINIDDCFNNDCPYGKVCVDLINNYECRCPPGLTGENCTLDLDPCSKEPCLQGSTCLIDKITRNYTCICAPGFTGPKCNVDIDECKLPGDPICNHGICQNKEGSFECFCRPGYTGERCSVDVNECLSMPCRNNATCLNKINNFECVCPPGYEGKDCSININECDPMPCMAGSTCIDGINAFTCICQPGLTGKQCDINIDDCESSPCLNGAQCIDGLNMYTCNCSNTGYTGLHCEINIDDCIGNPCLNGAECVDEVKDYLCNCYPGYTGKNCEEDINECESNPCKFSGTCLEKSNETLYHPNIISKLNITLPETFNKPFDYNDAAGYECLCVPGVTGQNCEININECESYPCLKGTCVDKIGGYFCECDEGFEGEHCDIDIDECEKYKPCIHGKCLDKRANYYCECEPNFGGKNCSVALIGCLDNPCLNDGSCKPYLINENVHKFNCSCPNGYHGQICEQITTMSLAGNSLVMVNTTRDEGYDIQFRFKTTLADGLLALGKGLTYYILELSKGRLNLHSSLLNKWEGVFIGTNLNDSNWQRVFVAINSTHLVLSANDEQTIYPITFNENYNATYTSFPLTYIGGIPNNLRKLTHGPTFLVGCTEDVLINNEWVLPGKNMSGLVFQNVDVGCVREPQCNPNPCHSGGHCTDMWRDFRCTCERPYLGHICQYNYTAATFGYENITDSLVTVDVADSARRAIRSIVHISMFIRTRQSRGQIFYLGSVLSSTTLMDETYIAAQLESGELLVRIQFNGTPEAYTVGGVKLDNGFNHLIEVIRNITLVQVKLNGTEYFRKTISASGALDAQVLFLGGQPQLRSVRQASDNVMIKIDAIPPTSLAAVTTLLSNIHFKGIIQDVQISNGSSVMVVEFFPLQADDLEIPMSFGTVSFDKTLVLEGIHSDNSCKVNPCQHNGVCQNTWNDYVCICPRGFKGKDCTDQEFCELEKCPNGSKCKNLDDGYECLANATFNGKTAPLQYNFIILSNSTKPLIFDTIELTYRTRSWGTVLFARNKNDYFIIFIYHNEVVVEWTINRITENHRFRKDHFEGQWLNLYFIYKDSVFFGGFKEAVMDESPNFEVNDFDFADFVNIFVYGTIYIAGSDNVTFDYHSAIENSDYNMTGYIPTSDTTTTMPPLNNAVDFDTFSDDVLLLKVDQNKQTDLFKGCLSEIRIGGLLLPFFTTRELYPNNHYSEEFFELASDFKVEVGCTLCYSSDCFNKGFCINPFETYKCNCTDGYTADDCSIDINECENNQCQNNATCKDLIARYECECIPGYNGDYCQYDIDECLSNPCKHGGTCIDLIGTFKCECPDDFVGKQCEAPLLITCDNKPCKEGATCKTGPNEKTGNNFTCICTEGMEGPYCDIPFCLNKHCEKGYCNTTGNVPFCQCQRGFEGTFCEININDCVSPTGGSPCQNGGVCIDGVNRYDCNCNGTGYTGLLCEIDIDECKTNSMACGTGVCQNEPGTYKCVCKDKGKCGHFCLLDDPCVPINPCEHGDCVPQCLEHAEFVCNCHENYTGKNCTTMKLAASHIDYGINILYIVVPIVFILLVAFAIGMAILVNVARSKRATRGTYSPSAQEFCNPRVELDNVLKPPPEERLI